MLGGPIGSPQLIATFQPTNDFMQIILHYKKFEPCRRLFEKRFTFGLGANIGNFFKHYFEKNKIIYIYI